jgi:YggT family protein
MEREEDVVREEPGPGPDPVEPGPYTGHTVRESRYSEGPIEPAARTDVVSRWSPARRAFDVAYLIFAVIDVMILIRILLKLLGANTAVPFTGLVYAFSDFFLAPFRGLFPVYASGRSVFEPWAVIGLIVYALLGYLLARLIAIMFRRDVTVAHSSGSRFRPGPF